MPTFVVVILDRLPFRINLAVLLTNYTLYTTATYEGCRHRECYTTTVATYAGGIWIDFLVSTPVFNLTP